MTGYSFQTKHGIKRRFLAAVVPVLAAMLLLGVPCGEARADADAICPACKPEELVFLRLGEVELVMPRAWIDTEGGPITLRNTWSRPAPDLSARNGPANPLVVGEAIVLYAPGVEHPLAPRFEAALPYEISIAATPPKDRMKTASKPQTEAAVRDPAKTDESGFWPRGETAQVYVRGEPWRPFRQEFRVHCSKDRCRTWFLWRPGVSVSYRFSAADVPKPAWVELDRTVLRLLSAIAVPAVDGAPPCHRRSSGRPAAHGCGGQP